LNKFLPEAGKFEKIYLTEKIIRNFSFWPLLFCVYVFCNGSLTHIGKKGRYIVTPTAASLVALHSTLFLPPALWIRRTASDGRTSRCKMERRRVKRRCKDISFFLFGFCCFLPRRLLMYACGSHAQCPPPTFKK
jgi:hypothetical protein